MRGSQNLSSIIFSTAAIGATLLAEAFETAAETSAQSSGAQTRQRGSQQRSSKGKKGGKSWRSQPREFMATMSGRNPQSQSGDGPTAFSVSVTAITGSSKQAQKAQELLAEALRQSGIGGRPYVKRVNLS